MNTDRNLLFGALAFQNEYIDLSQFAAACRAWAADKSRPLTDVLVERGWITVAVAAMLDEIVERKLKRYGGDAHATLGAVADPAIRDAIRDVNDSDMSHAVSTLPPAAGHVLVEAVSKPAEGRSRYTLTRLHAEGGIGRVWLARDEDLNREVALKELLPHRATHPDAWRRFLKEAQITGQLEHPNIVPVYELARRPGDDQPFYTMRFVRGQTLRDAIADFHPGHTQARSASEAGTDRSEQETNPRSRVGLVFDSLEFRRLLNAFISVCHAIAYAHSRGVVHRDLKPANVVLGGFGEVLVLDWGIAKVAGATDAEASTLGFSDAAQTTATQTGALLGTPEYMAPEQAEGRAELIDARTDIYGLGGILFSIATGQPPRRGEDTVKVIGMLLDNPTPRVRSVAPAAPAALDAICARAMAKERDDRYASASELAAEVERYLADEPVAAYHEPWPARLGRWMRRHRTGTQAAAVILLAVTLVSVLATVLVNEQRRIAERAEHRAVTEKERADENARAERATAQRERQERGRADAKEKESHRHLYIAHMNLAQSAWEDARVGAMVSALQRYALGSGDEELRGFEWFYWDRLAHSPLLSLKGHTARVFGVAFSPDGLRLASACEDYTVKVWDAISGTETLTLKGHGGGVTSVGFSPDGKKLASSSLDGTSKLWEATTGQEILTFRGHTGPVWNVAFSPDGAKLASASDDGTVKVWNVATGHQVLTLQGHGRGARVAFSSDGRRIASGGEGTVTVWDATTGDETLSFKTHTSSVTSVVFSPTGDRLASASADGTVTVWDARIGHEILTLRGHTGRVLSVVFNPDGRLLASGGSDQTLRIWDLKSRQNTLVLRGHDYWVSEVAFSPDGRRLASASLDHTVKVWDATNGQGPLTLSELKGWVTTVTFGSDSQQVAAGNWDFGASAGEVRVWDTNSGKQILTLNTGPVRRVAFSPNGKLLALSGWRPGPVRTYDAMSGQQILSLEGHKDQVWSVAFSPDSRRLASASFDQTIKVWDATNGQETLTLNGHSGRGLSVAFSPDGKRLASASEDGTVKLWDASSGQETLTLKGHTSGVTSVAFSPDGKRLASASGDQSLKIWDAISGRLMQTLKGHTGGVHSIAWGHDGSRLVSGSYDQTVKIWDAISGEAILTFHEHTHEVSQVDFSADGSSVASASLDGTVRVWDARPWTPELKSEQEALGLLRFLCAKRLGKEQLIESIRGDATISEPVRRRALELAETFWERDQLTQRRNDANGERDD